MTVGLEAGADLGAAVAPLLAAGATLRSCERLEIDLEDAFARIVEDVDDPAQDRP